jgi:(S)-2-hydroxyglutarate dehydrogenase
MVSVPNRSVVIGGGIVGLATAVAMAERGHAPIVLEAEDRVAAHQTGHNSGVIHSGLYYKPGSLKARTCRAGLEAMYHFCAEENVAHRRCGKLVVAVSEEELPRLAALEERGRANGVQLTRLGPEEIKEREPHAAGIAGLWIPETGVVDYTAVTSALARRLTRLGGEVRLAQRVAAINRDGSMIIVETASEELRVSRLVNCAGLQSDRIARMAGVEPGVRIIPFRGEYYTLRSERSALVRGLIYPVPDPDLPFLGVHFTRGIDDVVEAGPNAVLALRREGYTKSDVSLSDIGSMVSYPGFWKMARRQWRNGWVETRRSFSKARFVESLRKLVPALEASDIEKGGSGVRAQAVGRDGRLVDDFFIQTAPGMVHVLNAPSPAATASIAIGREIADRILGEDAKPSSSWTRTTTPIRMAV